MIDARSERAHPLRVGLEALPLAALVLVASYWLTTRESAERTPQAPAPIVAGPALEPRAATSTSELIATFDAHDYQWPPTEGIPRLALTQLPRDLAEQPASQRETAFLRILLPLILAENNAIRRERQILHRWDEANGDAGGALRSAFEALRRRYGINNDFSEGEARSVLETRVDIVPPALALAQAAIETGWGSSGFARDGNNLFGERPRDASQGIAPRDHETGTRHYVRHFPSLRASVRAYIHNLNTHRAYSNLRARRRAARSTGKARDGVALAAGLAAYSERGQAYVEDVRTIIRQNDLDEIAARVRLRDSQR